MRLGVLPTLPAVKASEDRRAQPASRVVARATARQPPRLEAATGVALGRHVGNRSMGRLLRGTGSEAPRHEGRVLARDAGGSGAPRLGLPDGITCKDATDDQAAQIGAAHQRGKTLAENAARKLERYTGSAGEVRDAMNRHFHVTGRTWAQSIAGSLRYVVGQVHGTSYLNKADPNGSTEAMAIWCVPFTDIRVYPLFYAKDELDYRGSTLLHEWMHRYDCDLDLGYAWEPDYGENSSVRQFFNADAYAMLAYEIGKPNYGDYEAPRTPNAG